MIKPLNLKEILKQIEIDIEENFEPPTKKQIETDMEQEYEPRIFPYSEWLQQYYKLMS
jgi:hypothetical protein